MAKDPDEDLTYEERVAKAEAEDQRRQLAALGKNGGSESMKALKSSYDAREAQEENSRKMIGIVSMVFMALIFLGVIVIYFVFKGKV